jgi:predicted HD phosphohydrolase
MLVERGGGLYGGEPITQLAHGLQCAALAHAEGAAETLILAALFHDLGHLIHPDAEAASAADVDARHERIGATALERLFGPAVAAPVRGHVSAKRYLAREAAYRATLSEESTHTLGLQGGPMTDAEAASFMESPGAPEALRLRRWDDAAKIPDAQVPGPRAYAQMVARHRRERPRLIQRITSATHV